MNKCADSENSCSYILYINEDGTEVRQEKKKFKTSDAAIRVAMLMNSDEKNIHKYVAYKCYRCGFYHIGHTSKLLTYKDRLKAKQFITYSNLYKQKKNDGYDRTHKGSV
jgi:hypothetical protein